MSPHLKPSSAYGVREITDPVEKLESMPPFRVVERHRHAVIQIKTQDSILSLDCDITGYDLDEIFDTLQKKCKKYLDKSDELVDIYFRTEEEERYEN